MVNIFLRLCFILTLLIVLVPSSSFAEDETATPEIGDRKVVNITWARTSEPSGAIVLPVASWKWSDVKDINYSTTSHVWDGGTLGNSHIKDAVRSWDIATWHTSRSYWNGTSHVRRFHGEFTIPDGYNSHDDIMISSVGNYSSLGLQNIIPINDDIYVFVYPKDSDINDENYLDYFAFWTGTACQELARTVNNGELITFHGISGTEPYDYKEIAGNPIPGENLLSHSDGWYCIASEDNIGYILKNNPEATEFVIDLIIEDYAGDGGMDRLDLTFTKVSESESPDMEDNTPSPPSHTVTFNSNGGTITPDPQLVDEGNTALVPIDVTKEGFIFIGWYPKDSDIPWDFASNPVTGDSVLYAKWLSIDEEQLIDEAFPVPSSIPTPINEENLPVNPTILYVDDNLYEVVDENNVPYGSMIQDDDGDWTYRPYPINTRSCFCNCLCPILWLIHLLLLFLFYLKYKKGVPKEAQEARPQQIDTDEET